MAKVYEITLKVTDESLKMLKSVTMLEMEHYQKATSQAEKHNLQQSVVDEFINCSNIAAGIFEQLETIELKDE